MASSVNSVWAIDIGSNALKALRITEGEDGLEVIGFDFIEHRTILTSEDVEPSERAGIVAETMHKFAERNDVEHDKVAISVAGHNSFARFIKLPPVEQKRIPEIVQFEAVQQIPFDINEVEWDWQLMDNPDSDETEVGLFAIKNELIAEIMDHFAAENMQVGHVQIAPIALHNYANFDRSDIGSSKEKATVILDMGADNTTLVVSTKNTVWQRSIRIGGNTFTEAIQDKFDISFRKAEKLKRTALMSKYVRQIFSAMKPIYTDLGSEVQRSLGFYSSSGPGRDKGFSKIIAIGGGMKLKGVAKYLQQTLGIPVEKLDKVRKIKLGEGLSEAKFHENISDFMIAYGLGVQVLDDPAIKSNLLPRKIVRAMEWARKAKVLTVAASIFCLVSVLGLGRAAIDSARYSGAKPDRNDIKLILSDSQRNDGDYNSQQSREEASKAEIDRYMAYFDYRDVVPDLAQTILACLPDDFAKGDISAIKLLPREERKQLVITAMTIHYSPKISLGMFKEIRAGHSSGGRRREEEPEEEMLGYEGMEGYGMEGMGGMEGYGMEGYSQQNAKPEEDGVEKPEDGPGFVVTIEGYSPYKDIGKLLDPSHVGDDKSKWGIVTWFEALAKQGRPFKLYIKDDEKHFKQDTGDVEYENKEMPGGIGEYKEIQRFLPPEETARPRGGNRAYRMPGRGSVQEKVETEKVLIDSMTGEEMSKTYDFYTQQEIDSNPSKDADDLGRIKIDRNGKSMYIVRDHWFRLNVKFLWTDAPEEKEVVTANPY